MLTIFSPSLDVRVKITNAKTKDAMPLTNTTGHVVIFLTDTAIRIFKAPWSRNHPVRSNVNQEFVSAGFTKRYSPAVKCKALSRKNADVPGAPQISRNINSVTPPPRTRSHGKRAETPTPKTSGKTMAIAPTAANTVPYSA